MSDGSQVKVAVVGAIATVAAAVIGLVGTLIVRSGDDSGGRTQIQSPTDVIPSSALPPPPPPPVSNVPASLFINPTSGAGGTRVVASGEGFSPNEEIVFAFHVDQIGTTRANAQGKFSGVTLTIPSSLSMFAPQQFDVRANGRTSIKGAQAPFMLTG